MSKLSCNYFSERKFKLYLVFIIVFPILFYTPKFFEVSFSRNLLCNSYGASFRSLCKSKQYFFFFNSIAIVRRSYAMNHLIVVSLHGPSFWELVLKRFLTHGSQSFYLPRAKANFEKNKHEKVGQTKMGDRQNKKGKNSNKSYTYT